MTTELQRRIDYFLRGDREPTTEIPTDLLEAVQQRIAELERQIAHWESGKTVHEMQKVIDELENELCGVHSCGPHCKRPMCVIRRQLDEALAVLDRLADRESFEHWTAPSEHKFAREEAKRIRGMAKPASDSA